MLTPDNKYYIKGEMLRKDLLRICETIPGKILSIGCGTAFTEMHFKKDGAEVWGIDFLPESIEIAKQRIDRAICGDLEADDFFDVPEKYFDLIVATDILEHLRYPEYVVKKISKWLSNEGVFVISVPNSCHYKAIRSLLLYRDWNYMNGGIFDEGHYRIFTRKSILRFLEDAGFKVLLVQPNYSQSKRFLVKILQLFLIKATSFGRDYFATQWIIKSELFYKSSE